MNIVLLASQYLSRESNGRFASTVIEQVALKKYENEFSESEKLEMRKHSVSLSRSYSIWAVNKHYKKAFEEINPGDIALFYSDSKYHHCARIKYTSKEDYPEIANLLWADDRYSQLLILEDLVEVEYSREVMHEILGMSKGDRIQQGIRVVKEPSHEFLNQLLNTLNTSEKKRYGQMSGNQGASDKIAKEDYLSRKKLIEGVAQFYIGFTNKEVDSDEKNERSSDNNKLFLGIFGKWGKGKSSFIHLLHKEIENQSTAAEKSQPTYILTNVDCSLIDRKETLWRNILHSVIHEMEETRKKVKLKVRKNPQEFVNPFKSISSIRLPGYSLIEVLFNLKNVWKMLLGHKMLILFYILLIGASFALIDPPNEFELDSKNMAGVISFTTLLVTIAKTFKFKLGQLFLPNKYNQVTNSYFKSKEEFEQLIQITEKMLKKDHELRILITLDEIDRMNNSLLPELMECLQLFKAINQTNKVSLQFVISCNHDIVFPNVGNSITMRDPYLLVHSFPEQFHSNDTEIGTTRINSYKLGKEYMDKYLDLSVYLDDIPSFDNLIDKTFEVSNEENDGVNDSNDEEIYSIDDETRDVGSKNTTSNSTQDVPVQMKLEDKFTEKEKHAIKNAIRKLKDQIEPRNLTRLKNALILVKNLDLYGREIDSEYEEDLNMFVSDFLTDSPNDEDTSYSYKVFESAQYFLDKRLPSNPKNKTGLQLSSKTMIMFLANRDAENATTKSEIKVEK